MNENQNNKDIPDIKHIADLQRLNQAKLDNLKNQGIGDNKDYKAHSIISEILSDPNVFLNMNMNDALNLIKYLIPDAKDDRLKQIYEELIKPENYQKREIIESGDEGR